jgi:hypothetical protein
MLVLVNFEDASLFRSQRSILIKKWLQRKFSCWRVRTSAASLDEIRGLRILVLGVYLSDRQNFSEHLVQRFSESAVLKVTQRWAALRGESDIVSVRAVTSIASDALIPKFELLNRLLKSEDLSQYDILVVTDDDILLPKGFLEAYVAAQVRYDFSLAQPARALHSFYDHRITLRKLWFRARQTRFVEIGPLFSLLRPAFPLLLPFNMASPMGFGLDYVWPVLISDAGLKMGIIDLVSADHSYRPQGSSYSDSQNKLVMERFLSDNPHLTPEQARITLRRYV